jgi:hypothetical protein
MLTQTADFGETISVRPAKQNAANGALRAERLELTIPRHWWPEPAINVHAARAEEETLEWFLSLGFGERALRIIGTFSPSQYAGIPFPLAGSRELSLITRYLSLWLLWDDVDVERRERGFRIRASTVLATAVPHATTLFDKAWSCLFRELGETMSFEWLDALGDAMEAWSDAALRQTQATKRQRPGAWRISFADAMRARIETIGMYATARLIEYARGRELPKHFHEHDAVQDLMMLANKIVGLGNDIFSLGKDWASGYVNVVLALREDFSLPMLDAVRSILGEHDEAIVDFDQLARTLPSFGEEWDAEIAEWLRQLRYSCVGFTLWESRAPRYTSLEMLVDGAVVDPVFVVKD